MRKHYRELTVAVIALFAASIAAMSLSASAAPLPINGCDFDDDGAGTWTLQSDCTATAQIDVLANTILEGNGHTISAGFVKTGNTNNAVIGVIGVDNVTVNNLTIDGTGGTDLHLINTYESTNVLVQNTALLNSNRNGIVVNGSVVTVDNVTTVNSGWHGYNVDLGSDVTDPAVLNIVGPVSHSGDALDILVDDITEDVSVNDALGQYTFGNFGNARVYVWSDVVSPAQVDGMTIVVDGDDLGCYPVIDQRGITVNWNDSEAADLDFYRYQADADKAVPFDFTTTVNTSERSGTIRDTDGTYNYRVAAVDTSGNQGAWSEWCGVTLDRVAPVVAITAPSDGDVLGRTVEVRGSVEDDNPYRHYAVVRDSSNTVVAGPGTIYDSESFVDEILFSFDTTTVPDGEYTIWLAARDAAGNRNDSAGSLATVLVTVDNTRPRVAIDSPSNGDVLNGDVGVYASFSDVNALRYRINLFDEDGRVATTGWVLSDGLDNELVKTIDSTLYEDGEYRIRIVGQDESGNRRARTVTVTFDNRPDNKDECKDGGWVLGLTLEREFRNQGDCVSHFASENQAENNPDGERGNNRNRNR